MAKTQDRLNVDAINIEHRGPLVIEAGAHARISINLLPAEPARPRRRTRSRRKEVGRGRTR